MKIMKIMCIVMMSLLLLTSCAVAPSAVDLLFDRISDNAKADKKADENIELIVSAISEKDKEKLKSIFSKTALSEMKNFDEQFEILQEFLEGEFVSWEVSSARQTSTDIAYGDKSIKTGTYGYYITNSNEYRIYIVDFPFDTISEENQGVYMIYVTSRDYDGILRWKCVMKPGIYIPEVEGIEGIDSDLIS